jgi:hypothetical protein
VSELTNYSPGNFVHPPSARVVYIPKIIRWYCA